MYRIALPALAAALLAGCASSPADQARQAAASEREQVRLDEALAGLTPVSTSSCIQRGTIRTTTAFDEAMLFERSRDQVYRSETRGGGCGTGMRGDDILVFRSSNGGQYCAGDIVQTRSRTGGFFTGSCSLGDFTLYRREAR